MDPVLRHEEVDSRKDGDDHEKNPRQCRSVAHLIRLEGLFIEHQGVQISGMRRSAAGDQVSGIELLERGDHTVDQIEEYHRRKHGHCNVEEAADRACPVDLCRFIQ